MFYSYVSLSTVRELTGSHSFSCVHAKLLQLCPTLCNPRDCSLPGSSIHGILQARTLDWVTMPSSRGSSWSRDRTCVSCIGGRCFNLWATREAHQSKTQFSPEPVPPFRKLPQAFYSHLSEARENENYIHRKLTKLLTWITALSNSMKLWTKPCRASQEGQVMVESSDKTWSAGEGNGKPLQRSCLENPMNSMKRKKIWHWKKNSPGQ